MRHGLPASVFVCVVAFWSLEADVAAQVGMPIVAGVVADSATGLPLADTEVFVDRSGLVTHSDVSGEFRLTGLPSGSNTLQFIKTGYLPRSYKLTLSEDIHGEIDVGPILLSRGPPPSAGLSGTVVDANTGLPVIAASVEVNGMRTTYTNEAGNFRIAGPNLRWGENRVEFKRVGYTPMLAALWMVQDETNLDLDVGLDPLAVQLPEIMVKGDRITVSFDRRLGGFHRRLRSGLGQSLSREQIQRIDPTFVTDLFRRIPGVRVQSDGFGDAVIRFPGRGRLGSRGSGGCHPRVYLDGIRLENASDLNMMVFPEQLLGIEVYKGLAGTPPAYADRSACGAVLIWTR
jgi:hypothetical protein